MNQDYHLTPLDTLPNRTAGPNVLGTPKVLMHDIDHDGIFDFLYGDYDGDLIFCEEQNGHPTQKWSYRLPLNDATAWMGCGDFDGDGQFEFVAGC